MWFRKLVVESFQAIQRAEIEFGPGLNILYGPNDLGKSTLATAIRAALLVMPGSAEASKFTPWYADKTPRVSLTFADDTGHYWRVSKGFGSSGADTGAELHHSKDGTSFQLDSKARLVEEKLRTMLAWGIPAPGGKGGPRSLPTSFLANVLLGAQTDVDAILGQSLADDLDGTGKLRLTNALATLAQDPLFKKVFDAAQIEVDQCFTATGKRKRGQTSKFTEAGQHVKRLRGDLEALQRQLTESSAIEGNVNRLREERTRAQLRLAECTSSLVTVREDLAKTRARDDARARLETATVALAEIDARAARVNVLTGEVDLLTAKVEQHEADVSRALGECEGAESAVHAAEEAHRIATSEDGAKDRELRRAQLAEQLAEVNTKKQATQTRRLSTVGAIAARTAATSAEAALSAAKKALDKVTAQVSEARERATDGDKDVELTRAIIAYARWRAAVAAREDATRAAEAAVAALAEADTKDADATALDARAKTIEEDLVRRRALLPAEDDAKSCVKLERDLEMAEAALGGGLSVAVRPHKGIRLVTVLDQSPGIDEPDLSTERVFEAERSIRLSVGDLLDIEVTAGAAEKRRDVENLRARWSVEASPVLARAGVKTMTEVLAAIAAITNEARAATDLSRQAMQLRTDGKSLRERAADHEQQAAKLGVNDGDLQTRKDAIGVTDLKLLESHFARLGKSWEPQATALHAQKTNDARAAQTRLVALGQDAKVAEYQIAAAKDYAEKCAAASTEAIAALGTEDVDALLRSLDADLRALSARAGELTDALAAIAAEVTGQVEEAALAIEAARARLSRAKEAHAAKCATADGAKAEMNARIGERNVMRTQLEAMDRTGAVGIVAQREAELAALPSAREVSDADVAAAERASTDATSAFDAAKQELHTAEGALSHVGGAAVRDEVERLQEALKAAEQRERDLEVDADAWKLLLETLRAVENEEGAHLGRALAGPVAARFGELTDGRYKNLRLDAKLQTESVEASSGVADGAYVLGALSVGTRDQLATLIRVTIADQLKTAIVLDDHLVHTDPKRLAWFREMLTKTAVNTQVIVLTCRPEDYLLRSELPDGAATRDLAGGAVRIVDGARVITRWQGVPSRPPPARIAAKSEEGTVAE
jgi:hypothetical protein